MRVIRRRYSLALMNAIHVHQPARFRELSAMLPQASSSTLAETLGALEVAHLVSHVTAETAPTSTYTLTETQPASGAASSAAVSSRRGEMAGFIISLTSFSVAGRH